MTAESTSAPLKKLVRILFICPIKTPSTYIGGEEEEAICPSSTPSQTVSLGERTAAVSSILQSCELIFEDALRECHLLRKLFQAEVRGLIDCSSWFLMMHPGFQNLRVKCVSFLAFLAHMRRGDRVLALSEIAAKFQWSFDYARLLRMNPRISSGARSYLASRQAVLQSEFLPLLLRTPLSSDWKVS